MAHYALIDSNNIVQHVITGVDENLTQIDELGRTIGGSTEKWEQFYESLPWFQGFICKRTSYNHKIRKRFAGIGFRYDPQADVFINPQPFPSWTLDKNYDWQSPKAMPISDKMLSWDESKGDWVSGSQS